VIYIITTLLRSVRRAAAAAFAMASKKSKPSITHTVAPGSPVTLHLYIIMAFPSAQKGHGKWKLCRAVSISKSTRQMTSGNTSNECKNLQTKSNSVIL
jgi:hypothetical protein